LPPFPIDHLVHPGDAARGQSSQRVAIEIDQVGIGDYELVAKAGEHVMSIELPREVGVDWNGHEAIIVDRARCCGRDDVWFRGSQYQQDAMAPRGWAQYRNIRGERSVPVADIV
jgi:hypothetical protein